jgi:hypothetical protein
LVDLPSHIRLIRKLQEALGDNLCAALNDDEVVEIMLNPDGRLFIERLGEGVAAAGELSPASAELAISETLDVNQVADLAALRRTFDGYDKVNGLADNLTHWLLAGFRNELFEALQSRVSCIRVDCRDTADMRSC